MELAVKAAAVATPLAGLNISSCLTSLSATVDGRGRLYMWYSKKAFSSIGAAAAQPFEEEDLALAYGDKATVSIANKLVRKISGTFTALMRTRAA